MSGKMLKSGETSAAARAARAAESAKVTIVTRWTSTPTTAHASRFCDIARIARPVRVRATKRWSPQKITSAARSTRSRCHAMRKPPTSRMREESAVGTSLGWVPRTMMARFVSTIDVASVAISWRSQERGDGVGQAELAVAEPERVGAEHEELAVGKVDEARHAQHERQPRGHHGVHGAEGQAVQD